MKKYELFKLQISPSMERRTSGKAFFGLVIPGPSDHVGHPVESLDSLTHMDIFLKANMMLTFSVLSIC